jgi:hypothetical protein
MITILLTFLPWNAALRPPTHLSGLPDRHEEECQPSPVRVNASGTLAETPG